jgi:hypothetical protein
MSIPQPTKEHRDPVPAPFAAGTRLRYLGTSPRVGNIAKRGHYYLHPGDVVVVDHVTPGARGGMGINPLDDGYGPAWVEFETGDGASVICWDPVEDDYGHLVGGERVQVMKDGVQIWKLVGGKRIHTISEAERALWEVVA